MKKLFIAALLLTTQALATYTPQAVITDATSGKTAEVDSSNALKINGSVTVTSPSLALDATLSAMSIKLPATIGTHSISNSMAVNIASDQVVPVSIGTLPSGISTSAKQDTGNTSLSSIDGKITAVNTGAVVVSSSALPSGGATSALQGTGNTSLASIDSTLSTLNGKVTAVNTGAVVVASSALPSGAATALKQPALGTAGTPSSDVITVQGVTSMTALKVDPSGVTSPVSVASLPLPSGAATESTLSTLSGHVPAGLTVTSTRLLVDGSGVTQPVSAVSLPLPSGASTEATLSTLNGKVPSNLTVISTRLLVDGSGVTQPVSGTVTANVGTTNGLALDATVSGLHVAQNSTTSGQTGALIQGATTTAAPSYSTAKTNPLSLTTAGALRVDNSGVTQPISGTVAATESGTWNITNVSGTVSLPTGASTESTLSTLSGKVPSNLTVTSTRLLVDPSGVTSPISAASLPLPTGAATDVAIGSTTSGETGGLVQGATTTSAPTYVTAKTNPLSLTTAGALRVDGSAVTQPVSIATAPVLVAGSAIIGKVGIDQTTPGTTNGVQVNAALPAGSAVIGKVSIDQTTPGTTNLVALAANQSVNVAQINGVTTTMGNGASGTGVQRVTIANDSTGVISLATGANTIGALTANQSVNIAQMNGVTTTMGNGASGTGVQRVTIANDSTGVVSLATGANTIGALTANQSVNTAQINGVTPLMGAGNTGTGSARVTIASDQAAIQIKAPLTATGSGSAAAATVSTVITSSAPASAIGFILQNMDTSTANIRWAVGRTATTTLGQQLQPGRDSGFVPIGANVSICAESGTQTYDIQWIAQ